MSRIALAALAEASGFQSDPRFCGRTEPAPLKSEPEPEDPLARAWADGHATGRAEALAQAGAQAEADDALRARIELSFERLDAEMTEQLRQRLFATVEALCEAAITPLALDKAALAARVERAAGMLARADDERVLRLHPEDIKLVGKLLSQDIDIRSDSSLERGSLRIESQNGGVEDGPDHWRRAIAEALAQC